MKIAVLAHLHYPIKEPFAGGLEVHTHALVTRLMAHGHNVTLFATPQSDENLPLHPVHSDLLTLDYAILPQVKYSDEGLRFHQEHHAYQQLMLELKDSDFDIIHNNSLHYLPISMAKLLPMPMVTVLHTPPFPWLQSAVLLEKPCRRMQYILPSFSMGRQWSKYVEDYMVVPNGVDTNHWVPSEDVGEYAVWTGRIVPEKGAHYAIRAARRAGMKLYLAGYIQDKEYFSREVAPWLDGSIHYLGHLSHEEMRTLISRAGVFVATPCWEEPFGLTVIEAMACGTPVVAFDRGAMRELIAGKTGKVVPFEDVQALAEAMKTPYSREAARQRAQQCFSLDAMVKNYEKIYRQMIRKNARADAVTPLFPRVQALAG